MMFIHFLLPRNWSNPLLPSSRASARLVTWWSLLACNQQLRFVGLQLAQPMHIQLGYIYTMSYVRYVQYISILYNVQKSSRWKGTFQGLIFTCGFLQTCKGLMLDAFSHASFSYSEPPLCLKTALPVATILSFCTELTTHYHRKSFWYPKANSIQTPVFSYSCFPPGPRIATWHVPRRTGRTCPETWAFSWQSQIVDDFFVKKPSRLVI